MVTQSRIGVLPSVWRFQRGPSFPRGWSLGLMTPQHSLESKAYLPGPRARLAIGANKKPFWYVINYALTARQSQDNRIVPEGSFVAVALMGNSDQVGLSFRTQFFQVVDEEHGYRLSRLGVNFSNVLGSGGNPFFLRNPYPMPDKKILMNRTANIVNAANNVQLVLYGLRDQEVG